MHLDMKYGDIKINFPPIVIQQALQLFFSFRDSNSKENIEGSQISGERELQENFDQMKGMASCIDDPTMPLKVYIYIYIYI